MAQTTLTEVADQIQKYWSPVFTKRLRESLLLGGLVNKDYVGAIKEQGDTVRVSSVVDMTGQLLTVGTNADAFTPEALSTQYVDIKVDKRAVASVEFTSTAQLQSQLSQNNPAVMDALMFAMNKQINTHLYSLVSPSVAAPDHVLNSVTDMNASQLAAIRLLSAQAKWPDSPKYALVDPSYCNDLLAATTLVSGDYGANDAPLIGGKLGLNRFGFTIFEDTSKAVDTGLFFTPDFMHMVMQSEVQVKVSDLHSNYKFATVLSVDVLFGGKLGIQGAVKHITATAAA